MTHSLMRVCVFKNTKLYLRVKVSPLSQALGTDRGYVAEDRIFFSFQ